MMNSQSGNRFINRYSLSLLILLIGINSCFHKRELETYQALNFVDSVEQRISATQQFIRDYPKSDSLFRALQSVLFLMDQVGSDDRQIEYALKQRILQSDNNIIQFLDSYLLKKLIPDSVNQHNFLSQKAGYESLNQNIQIAPLIYLPLLSHCFQSDSLRNAMIIQMAGILFQSGYDNPFQIKNFSDQILALNDSLLISLSNLFLVAAIASNSHENIVKYDPETSSIDSVQDQNYYSFFTALAWNAYYQAHYSYALNLISQATKYGDLKNMDGYIILGAAQSKCDELSEGWANVLKGLILNPEAEIQSPKIDRIYKDLFVRIRGSRENPQRFLSQYRRSHR